MLVYIENDGPVTMLLEKETTVSDNPKFAA
jgi:hypothetical protein